MVRSLNCYAPSNKGGIADSSSITAVNFFIRSHNVTLSVAAMRVCRDHTLRPHDEDVPLAIVMRRGLP